MILVTHSLIGVVITEPLHNNWLIFFTAFFTHYLFDMLPHYHYRIDDFKGSLPNANRLYAFGSRFKTLSFLKIFLDFSLAVVLPLIFIKPGLAVVLAISGAVLPDFLSFLGFTFPKNKILAFIYAFHYKVHLGVRYILDSRPVFGMFLNIVYTLIALYLVMTQHFFIS